MSALGIAACGADQASSAPSHPALASEVVHACPFHSLSISLGRAGAGLGHVAQAIEFRNTGGVTCTIAGYPGIAGLNASGTPVAKAVPTPSGYMGGELTGSRTYTTVTLPPGGVAAALVEGTDVPMTQAALPCVAFRGLAVSPPDAHGIVRLHAQLPACSQIQVHPVIAGTTGRQAL